MQHRLLNFQALGALEGMLFWTDPTAWGAFAEEIYGAEPICMQDLQMYDDLFCGTDADIYIPLWASVCTGSEGRLLNRDTLSAVELYYAWGYRPVPMGGNPPDYIGQLFRFYLYLTLCIRQTVAREAESCVIKELEAAREHLLQRYLLDTLRMILEESDRYERPGAFVSFFRRIQIWSMQEEAEESAYENVSSLADNPDGVFRRFCPELYALAEQGPCAPISMEKPYKVLTAGRNNCGGKCVICLTVQEGCILDLETDCGYETPQIRACARGRSYLYTYLNPRRLRYPMIRRAARGTGKFRRVSWEEANRRVLNDWIRIRDEFGPAARYVNYGYGYNAAASPAGFIRRLLALDGGYLGYYNSYSTACTRYVTPFIYGDENAGNSIEDIVNSKLVILWSCNFTETVFGSFRNYYLLKAKEGGTRFIAIDPRFSDTAACLADQWIGIRPSTDGALADALAFVMTEEGLLDRHFLNTYCIGFDEEHMPEGIPEGESYLSYLTGEKDGIPKTPEWASEITGVPEETICSLAREMACTKPMCILPGYGSQRTGNGEQNVRLMALLACMTGNVGISGGSSGGYNQIPRVIQPSYPEGQNPYPGRIPSFLWSEAVRRGTSFTKDCDGLEGVDALDSNIRMIFNAAGNTLVNQHSDINATTEMLRDETLCISIVTSDIFMTSSARYSDVVLPAAALFEADNLAGSWGGYNDYLLCVRKAIEPLFACRYEYEVVSEWAKGLGLYEKWSMGCLTNEDMLELIYDNTRAKEPRLPDYQTFRKKGQWRLDREKPYIAFEEQIRSPEQVPFRTPSGKIEIFSRVLYDRHRPEDIPAIPKYVPCAEGPEDPLKEKYPLQLIGWHTKRRTHSIHDNNPILEELEPPALWIHPKDAADRGISDHEMVEVFNHRGRCRIPAKITNRIVQGVCAMAQGAWYMPDKDGTDCRGSVNVLTSVIPTPLAKGNPQHTNLVQVERVD
ncbi:MAG: molybdopterin-dependent oxidoreductase [Lachnospiraceae bacterium]|nr:molybdopterin-dependent oxidoreductase [Lachnospiraceae bacterium]